MPHKKITPASGRTWPKGYGSVVIINNDTIIDYICQLYLNNFSIIYVNNNVKIFFTSMIRYLFP